MTKNVLRRVWDNGRGEEAEPGQKAAIRPRPARQRHTAERTGRGDNAGGRSFLPPALQKALALADVNFQPAHGLGQVVDGIGVGKAQETFGLAAEVDTGSDADMGFFQQIEGQFHGAAA